MKNFVKDMMITIVVAAIIVVFGMILILVVQDNKSIKNKNSYNNYD